MMNLFDFVLSINSSYRSIAWSNLLLVENDESSGRDSHEMIRTGDEEAVIRILDRKLGNQSRISNIFGETSSGKQWR